jgi:hypothetical protein
MTFCCSALWDQSESLLSRITKLTTNMAKTSLKTVALAALVLCAGCAKEEPVVQVNEVTIGGAKYITSRTFIADPPIGPDCVNPPKNCIWAIEIVEKKRTMVNQVIDLLQHGTPAELQAYFAANSAALVEIFAEQHVAGVVNATYSAQYLGAKASVTHHIGFYRSGNSEVELVYPLTFM